MTILQIIFLLKFYKFENLKTRKVEVINEGFILVCGILVCCLSFVEDHDS